MDVFILFCVIFLACVGNVTLPCITVCGGDMDFKDVYMVYILFILFINVLTGMALSSIHDGPMLWT